MVFLLTNVNNKMFFFLLKASLTQIRWLVEKEIKTLVVIVLLCQDWCRFKEDHSSWKGNIMWNK